jgi:hypothetical protein
VATNKKIDIVEHKKTQQCCDPEWHMGRPEHHTAEEGSESIQAVRSKTRSKDGPQMNGV